MPTSGKGNTIVRAGELNADNIGDLIRWRTWNNNRETATVITAELRQISHNQAETHLVYGIGAAEEATLDTDQPVTIRPSADYNDVATLALYDGRV